MFDEILKLLQEHPGVHIAIAYDEDDDMYIFRVSKGRYMHRFEVSSIQIDDVSIDILGVTVKKVISEIESAYDTRIID